MSSRPRSLFVLLSASLVMAPLIPDLPLDQLGLEGRSIGLELFFIASLAALWMPRAVSASGPAGIWVRSHFVFIIGATVSLFVGFILSGGAAALAGLSELILWAAYASIPWLYVRLGPVNIAGHLIVRRMMLCAGAAIIGLSLWLIVQGLTPAHDLPQGTIHLGGEVRARLRIFWDQGPNLIGLYISLLIGLAITTAADVRERHRWRAGALVLAAVAVVPLYFTFSRSAWIALGLGLIAMTSTPVARLGAGLGAVLGMAGSFILSPTVRERLVVQSFGSSGLRLFGADLPVSGAAVRIEQAIGLLPVWALSPIFGVGFGMAVPVSKEQSGRGLIPDDTLTALWVETGAFGFIAWFLAFLVAWRHLRYRIEYGTRAFCADVGAGRMAIVAFLVYALASDALLQWRAFPLLFFMIGSGFWQLDRRRNKKKMEERENCND